MAEVAVGYVSIVPKTAKGFGKMLGDQLGNPMQATGSKLGGFLGKSLKRTGIGVMASAGAVLAGSFYKGFGRLKSMEDAQAKLTGLGHSADSVAKIMDDALASVRGTAFGLDEAATVAASAVAAGIKPGAALEKNLTLVADAATIAGTDMASMGSIFNKVAGSTRGMQGQVAKQLTDQGIPIWQLLAETMGITTGEVEELSRKGQISFKDFSKAMEAGLGGAALESGKTFTGAMKNTWAALGRIGANLLSGVFPKLAPMFMGIQGVLGKLEPVAQRIGAAIGDKLGAAATWAAGAFARLRNSSGDLQARLEPVRAFVMDQVVPALVALGDYLQANLGPILTSIGDIISDHVVPILQTIGDFIYGTVYPAVFDLAVAVGGKLKPVFDALFGAIQGHVLPALSGLFGAIKGVMPVLTTVGGIVIKVAGFLLKLAATILGKVLPPVLRLAGVLIGVVVKAVSGVIVIVGGFIDATIRAGKAIGTFAATVGRKVADVWNYFKTLPGRITGALGGLGSLLVQKGKDVVQGFINGIKAAPGRVRDALLSLLPGPLKKFAGKLGLASPSKLFRKWGRWTVDGFVLGIMDRVGKNKKAMADWVKNVTKAFRSALKDKKGLLGSLQKDFEDLWRGIASSFKPDVFGGTAGQMAKSIARGLASNKAVLAALPMLQKTLGGSSAFFQDLLASGNSQLILALAANPSAAGAYKSQWNQMNSYADQIGKTVATSSTSGAAMLAEMKKTNSELAAIQKALKGQPKAFADPVVAAIMGSVPAGKKSGKKKVGKK